MMGSNHRTLESSMTVRAMFVSLGCLLAASAGAAPPSKNDYSSGMTVRANYAQPMIEAVLPDDVYRVVTRADLGICESSTPTACRCRTRSVQLRRAWSRK